MRKWTLLSDFPAFKAGKRWIIPVDAFREWLNKNAAERKQIISDD
jgi:putative SOS response-associated peptidase YedK